MSTPKNLKQLERRVYWYYHQDGLVDILFGLGLIGFGLMMLTGNVVYNVLGWIILVTFYMPIKKAVTIPRLGYVQFHSRRTVRWGLISFVIGVVVLILVLGLVNQTRNERLPASWQAMLREYDMLVIGALLSIPLTLVSALTGLLRPLAYIGLSLLVILAGIQLGIQPPIYMIALGAIIMLIGSIYLARFMIRHPAHRLDGQNGG
jgi:hypothetical protein